MVTVEEMNSVSPEMLANYLTHSGWKISGTWDNMATYWKHHYLTGAEIMVPAHQKFSDYHRRIYEAIEDLASVNDCEFAKIHSLIVKGANISERESLEANLKSKDWDVAVQSFRELQVLRDPASLVPLLVFAQDCVFANINKAFLKEVADLIASLVEIE